MRLKCFLYKYCLLTFFCFFADPESKTTRLSLCCAVTESSSHTPPHSHHFQALQHSGGHGDNEPHVIETKDSGSQTIDSNSGAEI